MSIDNNNIDSSNIVQIDSSNIVQNTLDLSSNKIMFSIKEQPNFIQNENTLLKEKLSIFDGSANEYKLSKEFIIFKNELDSYINNNLYILKECKANKRLLDIKYASLTKKINYIQISVIVFSTLSGFLQSTKGYFYTPETGVSVAGIAISTYISLILSVSKYYKFDESKEKINNLREKYADLHNKIEFRMDLLGPYTNEKLWEYQDVTKKLKEWNENVKGKMEEEYLTIIETKQTLTTEFETIMDSKSRNKNYIKDRDLILYNRGKLFNALEKHNVLEEQIKEKNIPTTFESSIQLPDDDLNNWDNPI
tara:strand:+ start:6694 stop:7617 length:924 start_codon:yes stop_codon:yes gene_type:complete